MSSYFLYILALEDENYYVGISRDVYKRYYEHKDRKGAHFTRLHHPIGLICSRELPTWCKEQAEEEETKITLLMMTLFGIEHVRGGDYYQANIHDVRKAMGESLYNGLVEKRKKADDDTLLKNYPEIKYGFEILKMHIEFPINVMSYHIWPTRDYFEKAVDKRGQETKKSQEIIREYASIFDDGNFDINRFKEMVNRVIESVGFINISISDQKGETHNYFLTKRFD